MHFVVVEEVAGFVGARDDALCRTTTRLSGKAAARTSCASMSEAIGVGDCVCDAPWPSRLSRTLLDGQHEIYCYLWARVNLARSITALFMPRACAAYLWSRVVLVMTLTPE